MRTLGFINSTLILLLVSFLSCTSRQDAGSVTETSYYSEQYRPQFHFTPDSMWMNDPNGMVFYDGEYHLFYQHHPHSNVWGPMHWGHAISTDLIHWEHLPIALYPDSLGAIFSGSAVIDWHNRTGFGNGKNPPMVAIFTHHNHELEKQGSEQFQYQSLAYSLDKGRSWTKYPGNPICENPGIRDFRDPKVIWHEKSERWIMVFAAHDRVLFYSSPDLINWSMESEFGEHTGAHGGVWECPDLFPMDVLGEEKWILLVSINPGGPNGGSATQYFVGDFDGRRFLNENPGTEPLWLDHGKDNYAGVTWSDIPAEDGRRLFLGWMSNWQYAQVVPTEQWRSAMTLPRELVAIPVKDNVILTSVPADETQKLRTKCTRLEPGPVHKMKNIGPFIEDAYSLYELDLLFGFDPGAKKEIEFGIVFESAEEEKLIAGFNTLTQKVFIDRSKSGKVDFSEAFPGIHSASYRIREEGEIRFHAFIDLSSIELFVDKGALVMTELCFPEDGFGKIHLFANHESVTLKKGEVYRLRSIW